jgi:excisionase family DNA binding protein
MTNDKKTAPLTVLEAAARLGLSSHTIRAWIAQRRIAHIRLGRAVRVPPSEIDRLLSENTVPAVPVRP